MSVFAGDGAVELGRENPVYRRAKPKRTSGSITWKSKWIPSYRVPELESIAAAYPKCALLYTCVEQRRGFFVQIKVVDGVVTDTRPEGSTASEVVQKAIAIPSIRRPEHPSHVGNVWVSTARWKRSR